MTSQIKMMTCQITKHKWHVNTNVDDIPFRTCKYDSTNSMVSLKLSSAMTCFLLPLVVLDSYSSIEMVGLMSDHNRANLIGFTGSCGSLRNERWSKADIESRSMRPKKEQDRIHGHQLRTGGQERKCAFSHFSTRAHRRTDGRTDGQSLLQSCVSATKKVENCLWRGARLNRTGGQAKYSRELMLNDAPIVPQQSCEDG